MALSRFNAGVVTAADAFKQGGFNDAVEIVAGYSLCVVCWPFGRP